MGNDANANTKNPKAEIEKAEIYYFNGSLVGAVGYISTLRPQGPGFDQFCRDLKLCVNLFFAKANLALRPYEVGK